MSKKRKSQKRLAQEWIPATGFTHAFLATILELISDGAIQAYKKSYDDDSTRGFWFGVDPVDSVAKLNVGGINNYLKFDGSDLFVSGLVAVNSNMDAGNLRIINLADATAATDALNRQTGDGRYLQQAAGWTGTFINGDGATVTVTNGQIVSVV